MNTDKVLRLAMIIIAVILALAIFKQFDFYQFRFRKLGLSIVYILGLVIALYLVLKKPKST